MCSDGDPTRAYGKIGGDEKLTEEEKVLSEDPTLSELFEFIRDPEADVRVLPVTVKQTDNEAQLFIAIQGTPMTANTIMAQLMTLVQDMYDMAEQQGNMAAPAPNKKESANDSRIVIP